MADISSTVRNELTRLGADIAGFGSLAELPGDVRADMPIGISVAVIYPKKVIQGIALLPTEEYREWYEKLNEKLDLIVTGGAEFLRGMGYNAVAQTRAYVGNGEIQNNMDLPHKTVATRAGIGWIGKSALLVTDEYGSAIRLSSILTDAPLTTAAPVDTSRCGECLICTDACPAEAVSGKEWHVRLYRDEFFDHVKCRKTAREREKQGFNGEVTICGKCIEACPYTQRYITS